MKDILKFKLKQSLNAILLKLNCVGMRKDLT